LLSLYCNICSADVDEKNIDAHINDKAHQQNKRKILDEKNKEDENPKSVIQIWSESSNIH